MFSDQEEYEKFLTLFKGDGFQPTYKEWQFQAMQLMLSDSSQSIALAMPPGSGKTFAYLHMLVKRMLDHPNEKTIIVLSSSELKRQFISDHAARYLFNFDRHGGFSNCRRLTVGFSFEKQGQTRTKHYPYEQRGTRQRVTFKTCKVNEFPDLLVTNYKLLKKWVNSSSTPAYSNIVFDEAHTLLNYSKVHKDIQKQDKFIIYSSATLKDIAAEDAIQIKQSVAESIASGQLCSIAQTFVLPEAPIPNIYAGDFQNNSANPALANTLNRLCDLWAQVILQGKNPITGKPLHAVPTLVYCPLNTVADSLAGAINDFLPGKAISYTNTTTKKRTIMQQFKHGEIRFLCTSAGGFLKAGLDFEGLCQLIEIYEYGNRLAQTRNKQALIQSQEIAKTLQRWGRLFRGQETGLILRLRFNRSPEQLTFSEVLGIKQDGISTLPLDSIHNWGGFEWDRRKLDAKTCHIIDDKHDVNLDTLQEIVDPETGTKLATLSCTLNPSLSTQQYYSPPPQEPPQIIDPFSSCSFSSSSSIEPTTMRSPPQQAPPPTPVYAPGFFGQSPQPVPKDDPAYDNARSYPPNFFAAAKMFGVSHRLDEDAIVAQVWEATNQVERLRQHSSSSSSTSATSSKKRTRDGDGDEDRNTRKRPRRTPSEIGEQHSSSSSSSSSPFQHHNNL